MIHVFDVARHDGQSVDQSRCGDLGVKIRADESDFVCFALDPPPRKGRFAVEVENNDAVERGGIRAPRSMSTGQRMNASAMFGRDSGQIFSRYSS